MSLPSSLGWSLQIWRVLRSIFWFRWDKELMLDQNTNRFEPPLFRPASRIAIRHVPTCCYTQQCSPRFRSPGRVDFSAKVSLPYLREDSLQSGKRIHTRSHQRNAQSPLRRTERVSSCINAMYGTSRKRVTTELDFFQYSIHINISLLTT